MFGGVPAREPESRMQVSDLIRQGCMLQARFAVEKQQRTEFRSFKSQLLSICNGVTFQIMVVCAPYGTFNMSFTKLPVDDRKYILKLSSEELQIENKCFCNDDGSWYVVHTLQREVSESYSFDVTVVLETVEPPLASIYDDDMLTDFELRCKDGYIKVHKAVLAAASPVLKRELEGDWRETREGCIKIPDTSKTTLQHFKEYLYLNKLPDKGTEQLLLLASYYMMPEFEQKCLNKLRATTNAQNALSLLQFAFEHQMTKLQLAVLECIESRVICVKGVKGIEQYVYGKDVEKTTE